MGGNDVIVARQIRGSMLTLALVHSPSSRFIRSSFPGPVVSSKLTPLLHLLLSCPQRQYPLSQGAF